MEDAKKNMNRTEIQPQTDEATHKVGTTENKGFFHSVKRRLAAVGLGAVVTVGGVGNIDSNNAQTQKGTTDTPLQTNTQAQENATSAHSSGINVEIPPAQTAEQESFDWINLIPKSEIPENQIPMNPKSIENFNSAMANQLRTGEDGQEISAKWDANKVTVNRLGTIKKVTPDKERGGVWVTLDEPGGKLTKITDGTTGEVQYYGVKIDYFLQNDVVVETDGSDKKGHGLSALAPHLKPGDYISFAFQSKNSNDPNNAMNYFTFDQMENSIGLPDKGVNTEFKIKATTAFVFPNQDK